MSQEIYYRVEGAGIEVQKNIVKNPILNDNEKVFMLNILSINTKQSIKEMALKYNCCDGTIKRHLRALKKKNIITIIDGIIRLKK